MKTLVVGAAMVEMIMKIDRLPKSGEDVLCKETKSIIGGCAYNAASTLRNLECDHDLCVPVGAGTYADVVAAELSRLGYGILIKDDSMDNGCCIDLVEATGERTFITTQGIEGAFKKAWFDGLDMRQYQNVYVAGYQVCTDGGSEIAGWLQTLKGQEIYFAPGPVICMIDEDVMEKVLSVHPVLHLNEKEAFDFTKAQTVEQCLEALYSRTGNLVFITLGGEGTVFYDGTSVHKIPACKASVVDTIGAGDSHIGAIIGGISKGLTIEESVTMANKVSACIVGVQGPTMSKKEFDEKMGGYHG